MALRVLNLLNSDHRRGAEAFGVDLGRALRRRGVDVRTVALTTTGDPGGHDVEHLRGAAHRPGLRALRHLVWLARRADVIVGHGGRTLLAGALVRTVAHTPFVYRVIGEPGAWAGKGWRRRRVRWAMRRADAVAVYHPGVLDELVDGFGVDPRRVHVLRKGIDPGPFRPVDDAGRAAARRHLGLPADPSGPVVAVVGALVPAKNVEQVVRAVAGLPGAVLLVVGDGPSAEELRALAAAEGVEASFTPPTDDVAARLAAADVVALTSRTEGVPTVLLEAALCGLGVVATPVGGVPTVVVDGEDGRLVALDDVAATTSALAEVAARRTPMGAAGRARVLARHHIDVVAGPWEVLLRQVAGSRPSAVG